MKDFFSFVLFFFLFWIIYMRCLCFFCAVVCFLLQGVYIHYARIFIAGGLCSLHTHATTTTKKHLSADHVHIVIGLHDALNTSQWQVIMCFKVCKRLCVCVCVCRMISSFKITGKLDLYAISFANLKSAECPYQQ